MGKNSIYGILLQKKHSPTSKIKNGLQVNANLQSWKLDVNRKMKKKVETAEISFVIQPTRASVGGKQERDKYFFRAYLYFDPYIDIIAIGYNPLLVDNPRNYSKNSIILMKETGVCLVP
ncbi:hypothetical protein L6Q85_13205 [bacterium]|nr:hypothetical protein [bacterium]